MSTFTKIKMSGSTDGRGVKVVATSSTGTTIHTADATAQDEVWLYAYNSDSVDRLLTIQFGGTTSPNDDIKVTVPHQQGLMLVVPGLVLTNSVVVAAYASAANVITIQGFVNRIS
jgi:hypothetical protein